MILLRTWKVTNGRCRPSLVADTPSTVIFILVVQATGYHE